MSLIGLVVETILPREYYLDVFYDKVNTELWPIRGEVRVGCCFHRDRKPSLYCNLDSGAWYCHGCGVGGKSIVSFDSLYNRCSHEDSAEALYHYYIHPVIPYATVEEWSTSLKKTPSFWRFLREDRLLSVGFIENHDLGVFKDRISIPIYNEHSLCVNAKLYLPSKRRGIAPKMLSYEDPHEERSFGKPAMLYPVSVLDIARKEGYVIITEGELDAGALLSMGVPAVTSTHGCKSWPAQYNELFRNLDVGIAYDNDEDGKKFAKVPAHALANIAKSISRISIPDNLTLPDGGAGKDVTDWLLADTKMRNVEAWQQVLEQADKWVDNPDAVLVSSPEVETVTLDQATSPQYSHKIVHIDAMVSGKGLAPYHIPKKYRAYCDRSCDICPLRETDIDFTEITIAADDPFLLEILGIPKSSSRKLLLHHAKISSSSECFGRIEEVEVASIEQLVLIPTLDSATREYVTRNAYFVGHGLRTNSPYRFTGLTIPHPKDQQATHQFTTAKPLKDEVDTFELTDELKTKLRKFQPTGTLSQHFNKLANWQSGQITRILERPDLHTAIDLVFHSVKGFNFNGENVRRGMLDVLVIGDTRCGKGYVAERLLKFYALGEIASGENCSFAGLVGGVQQISSRWFVTWGLIPLNNNRLVVLDEASSLSTADIGHMSRVRSEGIAEISKIARETTQANTRLIWLANPRSGLPIGSYNTGVEAIKELVGANEDISRYDYAVTVATDEVPADVINSVWADRSGNGHELFSESLCRSLILWAWSRKQEEIIFTEKATASIIQEAINFGRMYSPIIPLVQSENIRIKIAKVAAAIAARTFSTDEQGNKLIITSRHVRFATQFLQQLYNKPSMGYDRFSQRAIATSTMSNERDISKVLSNTGSSEKRLVEGLLTLHKVTPDNLADYVGGDMIIARTLISDLVMLNCLRLEGDRGRSYLKNPAFREWLKRYQETL